MAGQRPLVKKQHPTTPRTYPTAKPSRPHPPHTTTGTLRSVQCRAMPEAPGPRSRAAKKAASSCRRSLLPSSSSCLLLLLPLAAMLTTTTVQAFTFTQLRLPTSSKASTIISSQPKPFLFAPRTSSAPSSSSSSSALYASFFAPKPSATSKGKKEGKGVQQVRAYFSMWNERRMNEAVACFSGTLERGRRGGVRPSTHTHHVLTSPLISHLFPSFQRTAKKGTGE